MIQRDKILTELYGTGKSVVGFRQPANPSYAILTGANLVSLSGVYLSDGLVTIQNIKECQDYKDITNTEFNTTLANYIKDAIINACDLVFTEDDKLEYGVLYNQETAKTELLDNGSDFVGYEINVLNKTDILTILNSLITEFNAAGELDIYLYHSSQKNKIESQPITLTESSVETSVEWLLDKHKTFGGTYYVGYYTDGLVPKAINRILDNSYYRKQFKNVLFRPIKVTGHTTVNEMFDIELIQYENDTYGLNFNTTVNKDYTDYIITNKKRFAKLIKYQFQADMLRLMITSTRSNAIERKSLNRAQAELDGILTEDGKVYSQGIIRKLENEAKKLYKEFIKRDMYPTINKAI